MLVIYTRYLVVVYVQVHGIYLVPGASMNGNVKDVHVLIS